MKLYCPCCGGVLGEQEDFTPEEIMRLIEITAFIKDKNSVTKD